MAKKIQIDFQQLSEEVIKNAREDREKTNQLLYDLLEYIKGGEDRVASNGLTLAKYVETLQRSNEQITKIAALARKEEAGKPAGLSDSAREAIFEKLKKDS